MKLKIVRKTPSKGKKFGYIRVSTPEQNIARQKAEMLDLGIDEKDLYVDFASGKSFDRPQYQALRRAVRPGDVIFFDSLDRLGRNYEEMKAEWMHLENDLGVDLVCLDIKAMDTREFKKYPEQIRRFMEDLVLNVLSWRSSSERDEILRRQKRGIEIAKAQGKYRGKPRKDYDHALFEEYCRKIRSGEIRESWAVTQLRMSRSTFERRKKEWEKNNEQKSR